MQLSRMSAVVKLVLLSPKPRLAWLYMVKAHGEDHKRYVGDTLLRYRNYAWVVRGRPLAKKVVKKCGNSPKG